MGLLDKKKILEKILKLKFEKQTKEIKEQIQKLQQKIDDLTDGTDK
jgi:tetrahydromethanopterin S-methyltransferase subunit B